MKTLIFPWAMSALLVAWPAAAHDKHDHHGNSQRHNAHEHGIARLNLVMHDDTLMLELQSPAANIVGFEHAPQTAEQKQQLAQAQQQLALLPTLLKSPHRCQLHHADVRTPGMSPQPDDHHHHGDSSTAEGHGEFHADYVLSCEAIELLTFNLMAMFPAIQQLEVQWITDKHQGYQRLTPAQPQLRFTR
ncbi:hypothetical protein GCM10011297_32660 [Bacterioplanes sanyensis]|uniref:ZrgA family zinc uptake protein n=1 Tax=Bacterioplanes sanyensis TaxID=1249553 RepID=UPI001672C85E|nr:DUF2796 domain-containing protein [Bacterioplanes sanyensis]GGY57490.1 hypothetical protein GCM10011297_32660 [Bacterioplanes sanyensis]